MHELFSRRHFMRSGFAVSAAASLAAVPSLSNAAPSDPLGLKLPIHLALFDTRFPAAHAFGRALGARGVPLAPFNGDVTPIWFEQLDPVWRHHPLTVAGLTTEGALFCLEQLAWDNGMRVAFRGMHAACSDGGVEHVLEASIHRAEVVRGRMSHAQPWPTQMADLIASIDQPLSAFPSDKEDRSRATYRTRTRAGSAPPRLVSWLIAPKNWRSPEQATS